MKRTKDIPDTDAPQAPGAFRFLHAADIHLDSPLRGLQAYEGAPVEMLRGATRQAFGNLIDLAIEQQVAFVLLAGDLYDGAWRDFNTGLFFIAQMRRLHEKGIAAFIVYGNHDAESELTKRLELPPNVHEFQPKRASTVKIDALKVAVHGQSFRSAAVEENLVPAYPAPQPGWLNIGLLHTALEGNAEHATYAPCSAAELVAKGYDYWALGHVHAHQIVRRDPWIVFPGNLQGRHVKETGAKGAVLVSVRDGVIETVEHKPVDVLRWAHLRVDVSASSDTAHALGLVSEGLADLYRQSDSASVAVRVTLTGQTALHGALFQDEARIAAETRGRAIAVASDRIWVEKVRVETSPPRISAEIESEALTSLDALLDEVCGDPRVQAAIEAELREMSGKLPHELQEADSPALTAIRNDRLHDLAASLRPGLASWLEKQP